MGRCLDPYAQAFVQLKADQAQSCAYKLRNSGTTGNATTAGSTRHQPAARRAVFYGGGGGYGHIAVSIGLGQEVGTQGYVGQRLPVIQYPVVGFLSNPYLGWALPMGS